jgi:tetratricopeptide (TPR) repeat protein
MLLRSLALMRLGRFADVEKVANDRLAATPGDVRALRELVTARLAREDYAGVQAASLQLIDAGRATQGDYNNLAWNGLFTKVTEETIEWALKGAGEAGARAPAGLHTLAAVYADAGRTAQAREALLESIRLKGVDEPESHDWYVLGRIAEDYGEIETARGDYARVEKPNIAEGGGSTYVLAQRRLAVIGPATAAGTAPARARK